ncbi:MAG TPA: NADH-quinone oxidoreductase subunit J [Firmicutes bacterium]|nr:NADH-quinone oxidoreductase subunit J [Bacillota bacterium]
MYLINILLAAGVVYCAVRAVIAKRLLASALWLAGTSAIVAMVLYNLGARELAVIELSVGAGLVTILFVFAISIAGEEGMGERTNIPRPVVWIAVLVFLFLLGEQVLPHIIPIPGGWDLESPFTFALVLWERRSLDVMLQIVMIVAGVVSALGLLAPAMAPQAVKKAGQAAGHKNVAQTAAGDTAENSRRTTAAAGEVQG